MNQADVSRWRAAADIKGNGYRGARGKGWSARTAGVCLSAGCFATPRELAGRTPFPDRDRRSPPWSRHPPPANSHLKDGTPGRQLKLVPATGVGSNLLDPHGSSSWSLSLRFLRCAAWHGVRPQTK